jgi:hypothetical protein
MNPVEKAIRKLDATQRRFTPTAFVFGVVKKYGDDNGGCWYPTWPTPYSSRSSAAAHPPSGPRPGRPGQLRCAPVLDAVAAGSADREELTATCISSSAPASSVIIGFGLIWGATGPAQAGLFTMEQVWNLPGPPDPGSSAAGTRLSFYRLSAAA